MPDQYPTIIQDARLPRMIQRGERVYLTLELFEPNNDPVTISDLYSVKLYRGNTLVKQWNPPFPSLPNTLAQVELQEADTEELGLSESMLELWDCQLIDLNGEPYTKTIQRSGYLVLRAYVPTVTDEILEQEYRGLRRLATDEADFAFDGEKTAAFEFIQRRLIAMGRRPQLILDNWALQDVEICESLIRIFRRFRTSIGDTEYRELMRDYERKCEAAWGALNFRYDSDESGTITDETQESGNTLLWTS